jgi:hypothetical protein
LNSPAIPAATTDREESTMDLSKLADEAKQLINERGGVESLKEDAEELQGIATGQGSLADKAQAAVQALKVPGTPETPNTPA